MKTNKLSKKNKAILDTFRVDSSSNSITIGYKAECILTKNKTSLTNRSVTLRLSHSPTNNCQMASIQSFNYLINKFKFLTKESLKEHEKYGKNQKYTFNYTDMLLRNANIERLAVLKAFSLINTKVTAKKLLFIDINKYNIKNYYKMHPYIFKKRKPSREVHYVSTNKNKLMYSLVELDTTKLEMYR